MRAQPSAEIGRVGCAKCRREGDLSLARACLGSWKMRTGELVVQLSYAEVRTGDFVVKL